MHTCKVIVALCVCWWGATSIAFAHIEYYDLNQGAQIADLTDAGKAIAGVQVGASTPQDLPLVKSAYWTPAYQTYSGAGNFTGVTYTPSHGGATAHVNDVSDFGWGAGTQAALGDSHKVDFFNFRLASKSIVTVSWTVSNGAGTYFDSAFSIYRGNVVYQAHDDTSVDPLNPVDDENFLPIQNQKDTGVVIDAQGITSPYRDTLTYATTGGLGDDGYPIDPFTGQFDAGHSWSMGNAAGDWSGADFVLAVDALHRRFGADPEGATESASFLLDAGSYTIAASGALLPGSTSLGLTNLDGDLRFSYAAAVPEPDTGALVLLGSALCWVMGRLRSIA